MTAVIGDPGTRSRHGVAERGGWQEHVVLVDGPYVEPVAVTVAGDPAGVTGARFPMVLRATAAHSTVLLVDLGRLAMGTVEVGVTAASGAPVRVAYAQFRERLRLSGDGMGRPFGTDAHPWSRVDVFDPPAGGGVLRSPGKREARHLALTLEGPGELEIAFVRVHQRIYPVHYDGWFHCDDELLTRAWFAGAYTGDLATVSEHGSPWMLTVTFDRVLFMGDLHMQALAGYRQSSDHAWLVRNSLRQYVRVQRPDGSFPAATSHLVPWVAPDPDAAPTGWPADAPDPDTALGSLGDLSLFHDLRIDSFTAFWVVGVADHLLHTGDAGFAASVLPTARRAVGFLAGRIGDAGLYVEPTDRRTDPTSPYAWVANWSPAEIAAGVDAFTNSVVGAAFDALALLEEEVGDAAAAPGLRERAVGVRAALVEHLFDDAVGAFVLNDRDPLRDHTADANAGALLFAGLDPERARAVSAFLGSTLATPFGTRAGEHPGNPYRASGVIGYLNALEALGRVRHGDGEGAVDLIRRWWGHMLAHGPGTGWFACDENGTLPPRAFGNSSWTTPVPALSEGVLGIGPTAPGYRRWRVAPLPSGLRWAQGRVPAPGGGITVRWEHDDAGFHLTVEAPPGSTGEVVVPLLGRERTIARDGAVVWHAERPAPGVDARRGDDAVVFPVDGGTTTFAW